MSVPLVINGIGKGSVLMTPTGEDAPTITIELPLTQQGGYSELWDDESFITRFINADYSTKLITERQTGINGFGNWIFDYSNLPLPKSVVNNMVLLWNKSKTYTIKLKPKSQSLIGTPEREFDVNLIGVEGLQFITGDSDYSLGTFGIKLKFRTTVNQPVTVAEATGILPGGGSVFTPIEGGM